MVLHGACADAPANGAVAVLCGAVRDHSTPVAAAAAGALAAFSDTLRQLVEAAAPEAPAAAPEEEAPGTVPEAAAGYSGSVRFTSAVWQDLLAGTNAQRVLHHCLSIVYPLPAACSCRLYVCAKA